MTHQSLEIPRGGAGVASRILAGAAGHLRSASDFRRRAEMAVVERLDPGVSIDTLPVVLLVAVLATLFPRRRT
jgi:hypothetical protein